jgi:hypothetical protein
MLGNNIKDRLRADASVCNNPTTFDGSKESPARDLRFVKPCVDCGLGPSRHWHRSAATSLAFDIEQDPAPVPTLQMMGFERHQLRPLQRAPDQ